MRPNAPLSIEAFQSRLTGLEESGVGGDRMGSEMRGVAVPGRSE